MARFIYLFALLLSFFFHNLKSNTNNQRFIYLFALELSGSDTAFVSSYKSIKCLILKPNSINLLPVLGNNLDLLGV